jgi:hypothetical protein
MHMAEHGQAEPQETEQQQQQHRSKSEPNSSSTKNEKPPKTHYSSQFWLAFGGLCFIGLVSTLDGSIVSTALPSIVSDLNGAENYVWVVNVYFLTRYRLPLSNLFLSLLAVLLKLTL